MKRIFGLSIMAIFFMTFSFWSVPKANAEGPGDAADQFKDLVRRWYFMVAGYPTAATYKTLTSCSEADYAAGTCDAEPENGMIGLGNEFIVMAETIMTANGVASCSAIPSSGTQTGGYTHGGMGAMTGTLTFCTPDKSAPTGYPNAGTAFDKCIQMTDASENITVEVQFNCSSTEGWYGMAITENGGTRTLDFWYDNNDENDLYADLFMEYVHAQAPQNFALKLRKSNDNLNYYLVMTMGDGSAYNGFRMVANGDVSTKKYTAMFQMVGNNYTTWDELAGSAGAALTSVTSDPLNADETKRTYLFCIDGDTTPTLGTACTGLALTEDTGKTVIDTTNGAWNMQWVARTTNGLASTIYSP